MFKKIIRIVSTFVGISTGIALGILVTKEFSISSIFNLSLGEILVNIIFIVLSGLIIGFITFIITPFLINQGQKLAKYIEKEITTIPTNQIVITFMGLLGGFIIAFIASTFIKNLIPVAPISNVIGVVLYIFLGYLGIRIVKGAEIDFSKILASLTHLSFNSKTDDIIYSKPKVLDTSVIIDGRILDVSKTNFLEGTLIIPEFVLEELRHIADSSDALKRKRGRRGLDILKKLQTEVNVEVKIDSTDFEDVKEVDIKLIKLAQKIGGMVATHDYNLNKVAALHNVGVLNINELANAVKPIVLPGEEMMVTVVKEGKENNQGLAYLDDGTMIVIENGKSLIGQTIATIVTTALQTAAGKMIFVKPK